MIGSRLLAIALVATCSACIEVSHFTGEPKSYDGLYFGPEERIDERASVEESRWRIYALYGLVPYSKEATEFSGRRLAEVAESQRPLRVAVETQMSFLNALSAFGVNLLLGPFGPLVFVPRTTRVEGWTDEPSAEPQPVASAAP